VKKWVAAPISALIVFSSLTLAAGAPLYQADTKIRGVVINFQHNVTIQSFSTSHTFAAIINVSIHEILQKTEAFDRTDSVVVSYDYPNQPSCKAGDVIEVFGFWFPALDTPWSRTIRIDDQVAGSYLANIASDEPIYTGIAPYYDNRKAVVTVSFDDWTGSGAKYEDGLAMVTSKRLYHTAGLITGAPHINWSNIQMWLNRGYSELGSHSRTHQHIPYENYDSEVGGSKADIVGNLTLPPPFSFNGSEYVYTWIEPYGQSDRNVRQKLGNHHYLADRSISLGDTQWARWDAANGLFNRIGYTVEMGKPPSWEGIYNAAELNAKFDRVYNARGIYHLVFHPNLVDWTAGAYADNHTSYLEGRPDVWYVSFGNLYLYHKMAAPNAVQVSSEGFGEDRVFKIIVSSSIRQIYGVCYPLTHVFNISSSWTSMYTYYRYKETDQWTLMASKTSEDLFNGVNASRFDFTNHKAYVSLGFGEATNEIHLRLRSNPIDTTSPVADAGPDQTVEEGKSAIFNGSGSYDDVGVVEFNWDFGDGASGKGLTVTHSYIQQTTYTVTLHVKDLEGNSDFDTVKITIIPAIGESFLLPTVATIIVLSAGIVTGISIFKRRRAASRRFSVTA